MKEKINSLSGITLVALVVTIVVLIILATISIGALFGEKGIIKQAQEAKEVHEKGRNEEEKSIEDLMKEYNEVKDELSSGGVKINIFKYPETEKTRVVFLEVTSVEGITYKTEEIDGMSESKKKEIIKKLVLEVTNMEEGTNYTTFEECLVAHNVTEQEFWANIEELTSFLQSLIMRLGLYDETTNEVKLYTVTNPDGAKISKYQAMSNGKYTFTITDMISNKTYRKSIEVTNIDTTLPMPLYEVVGEVEGAGLSKFNTNEYTTFEKAYIIFKGEKIDITECIVNIEDYSYINERSVCRYLLDNGKINDFYEISGMNIETMINKDGIDYSAIIKYYIGVQ